MSRPASLQTLFAFASLGLAACSPKAPATSQPSPPPSQPVPAPSQPVPAGPTPESVEKMLEVTGVEKLNESVIHQLDGMTENIVARTFHGKGTSPQAAQLEDAARQRLRAIIREDLSWARMGPVYVRLYSENFSQADVDGVIAFYESKAQQDYSARMPDITKKTFGEIQQRIGPIMQKMQDAMKAARAQVDAVNKAAVPPAKP